MKVMIRYRSLLEQVRTLDAEVPKAGSSNIMWRCGKPDYICEAMYALLDAAARKAFMLSTQEAGPLKNEIGCKRWTPP